MGIKKIIYTLHVLLVLLVSGCKDKNDKDIQRIKDFYTSYLSIAEKIPYNKKGLDSLKTKYLTIDLIKRLESLKLDYDLILNSNDVDTRWDDNILVKKDSTNLNIYNVSYTNGSSYIKIEITNTNGISKISDIENIMNEQPKKNGDSSDIKNSFYSKVFEPYNSNCDIYIYIYGDSLFSIKEKGEIKMKGKFKKTIDNNISYYHFEKLEGLYYNDSLDIQNYGNDMNQYIHFKSCDEKYIHFVNILSKH
ncbi:hypothetical protein ACFFU9_10695 [Mariniflexile ostreae]|uniref:Lipoprotein n=1 Tax=Mariniflexile ostreae TaxID=1520892 RepID=A0ABV5FCU6_9FLAO